MKNPTYKSELGILHFYQVWILVKIQQKKQVKPKFNPPWIFDFFSSDVFTSFFVVVL